MMKKLSALVLFAAIALGGVAIAGPSDECVSYTVTAPVVGTRQGTQCSPPTHFGGTLSGGHCEGIPPAHVAACVTFVLHLP